ncbi:MAG TPA: outer membrane beta-barrel protein [Gemmatimonadales bacterium]|nr:outer membrane beta-barrel protein [Gemmatimonadales bacterium]
MRLSCLSVAALASALVAGPGAAQQQSPFTFGVGGSVTVPVGDAREGGGLGDAGLSLAPGWQGMGLFQIHPFGNTLGFQLDGTYQRVGAAAMSFAGRQQFNGTANVLYEFGHSRTTRVVPYVIGGAGVYSFRGHFDSSSTRFGLNAGAGLNLNLGLGTLFLESRFHNVFGAGFGADGSSTSAQLIPITAGFKFSGP